MSIGYVSGTKLGRKQRSVELLTFMDFLTSRLGIYVHTSRTYYVKVVRDDTSCELLLRTPEITVKKSCQKLPTLSSITGRKRAKVEFIRYQPILLFLTIDNSRRQKLSPFSPFSPLFFFSLFLSLFLPLFLYFSCIVILQGKKGKRMRVSCCVTCTNVTHVLINGYARYLTIGAS